MPLPVPHSWPNPPAGGAGEIDGLDRPGTRQHWRASVPRGHRPTVFAGSARPPLRPSSPPFLCVSVSLGVPAGWLTPPPQWCTPAADPGALRWPGSARPPSAYFAGACEENGPGIDWGTPNHAIICVDLRNLRLGLFPEPSGLAPSAIQNHSPTAACARTLKACRTASFPVCCSQCLSHWNHLT